MFSENIPALVLSCTFQYSFELVEIFSFKSGSFILPFEKQLYQALSLVNIFF